MSSFVYIMNEFFRLLLILRSTVINQSIVYLPIIISNHNEPYLPVVQKHLHGEQTVWSWYENFFSF